jgi:hypothetical protein
VALVIKLGVKVFHRDPVEELGCRFRELCKIQLVANCWPY